MTRPGPPPPRRTSEHLTVEHDLDRLADVLALLDDDGTGDGSGAVDPDDLAQALADRGHVQGCAACRAQLRTLTAADEVVRDALATAAVAAEPGLPADVAARLDAALAGLVEQAVAVPTAAAAAADLPAGAEADVIPLSPRRQRSGPRLLQAAASVAVLAVVGVGVATYGRLSDEGTVAGSADSGAATTMSLPASEPYGQDYRAETLAEQGAALAAAPADAAGAAARSGGDQAGGGGTTHDADPAAEAAVADALAPLRDPETLAGCLAEVTQTPEPQVAALDYATFEGRPALVIVVRGTRTEVYAVGPGCREGSADLLSYAATD